MHTHRRKFSQTQLISWNPNINRGCSNLGQLTGTWICIRYKKFLIVVESWQLADIKLVVYLVEALWENPLPHQIRPTIKTAVVKATKIHSMDPPELVQVAPAPVPRTEGHAHMRNPPPQRLIGNFHRLATFLRKKPSPPLLAPAP